MTKAFIHHYLQWKNNTISRDGKPFLYCNEQLSSKELLANFYLQLNISYPKFFKMDISSKLGMLASCMLMSEIKKTDPIKTGIICSTYHGCLEVDKAFEQSRHEIPSPALFVYTLPNIALGEICIYHKIKGPQVCLIEEKLNPDLLITTALGIFERNRAEACIIGHLDAIENEISAQLAWVSKHPYSSTSLDLNSQTLENLFR